MTEKTQPYEIRQVTEDDWDAIVRQDEITFLQSMEDFAPVDRELMYWPLSFGAFQDGGLIGYAGSFDLRVTVPGGEQVPMAAVTWVSTLPTHRRKGVLSALMQRQLRTAKDEDGRALACLWASETAIYGRFGYGAASHLLSVSVPRSAAFVDAPAPDPRVSFRLVEGLEHIAEFSEIYEASLRGRPGAIDMPAQGWWKRAVMDPPGNRGDKLRCVLATRDNRPVGYAIYVPKSEWGDNGPAGQVGVRHLMGVDTAARADMWRYILGIDLTATVEWWNMPCDEPLIHWVADTRSIKPRQGDGLYVRILDIPAALGVRAYQSEVDVVVEMSDALMPENAGRWRIVTGPKGAEVTRTDAPADLEMDIRTLGSAYLGDTSLVALGAAGRVREHNEGALASTSVAFGSQVAPWCPWVF